MIYYLTALINGFFNSVNRMTNVRAGKLFGTANGALINYVEATVLSLLLMLVLKTGRSCRGAILYPSHGGCISEASAGCWRSFCRSSGRCARTRSFRQFSCWQAIWGCR